MIGKYPAKLDEKNRLFVPAKLRAEMGDDFFVTVGINCGRSCLTIYTAKDWETLSQNYNALPISQRAGATSLLFSNAVECVPDKQFRFTLSQNLLTYAGIGRDVMIVGRAGQAEIWDVDAFNAFENENLTPEKLLASLEAIGL
ncbi:MAG: division/cell wall cluster transcriptional repressor MraZ [Ruminococcaceae bacterium]|nr:division/cell wall cluster transcriptional repressor MraZ [Oscillospiraceae bacterium]